MPLVHVRVAIDTLRLEFSGQEAFFERHIRGLIERAYSRSERIASRAQATSAASEVGSGAPSAQLPTADDASLASLATRRRAQVPEGFVPQSGQFSAYLQKVGARAAKPEQQLVAFAFYLWNYEDRRTFDSAELEGCFRAVGMNPPDPMQGCLADLCDRKRFLERAGNGDGSFGLTSKGVNYVKTRLLASV